MQSDETTPIRIGYVPNPDDWEADYENWMGVATPRFKHKPSGAFQGCPGKYRFEEYEYEPDPDNPGKRRILRGSVPTGFRNGTKPLVKRSYQERNELALETARVLVKNLEPTTVIRTVTRTQTIEVEVDVSGQWGHYEGSWAACEAAPEFTDEQWAAGTTLYSSDFWTRTPDSPARK